MTKDFEIFYNWNNSLRTNDKIQFRSMQDRIKTMKKQAYNESEMEEILLSEGYKHNLIKEALSASFKKTAKRTEEQSMDVANGVPKKYSDIAHKFEKTLMEVGPTKFVNLTTQGESPLIKISSKEVEAFQSIANLAYENPIYLDTLHSYIKPSVVSELAENICKARTIASKCSLKKTQTGYEITHGGKTIEASASPVKSSSSKFVNSNYQSFGFPDEYVIIAFEQESPISKLKKDLGN